MKSPDPPSYVSPSLLDPRVFVLVTRADRSAMVSLWQLEARLFDVVLRRREDMLAQLKLAWWRDRLQQLADDPAALPRGEPLLQLLSDHWGCNSALATMADGYEAALFAQTVAEAHQAADTLVSSMKNAMVSVGGGSDLCTWALVRVGQMVSHSALAQAVWQEAAAMTDDPSAPRAVRTLDRWSHLIARHGGTAPRRAEAWLLLRAGLGY